MIDKFLLLPISACAYATIVSPLILSTCSPIDVQCLMGVRPENKVFWPAMAVISLALAVRYHARLGRLVLPPHIFCFLAYFAFAGASVLWAFKPELSFVRFAQQGMIILSIVVPAMLATREADMMRGLFLCFALASIINIFFVFGGPPVLAQHATSGYIGYFTGKNLLGQCAAITLLLAVHEMLHPGRRRALGIIVGVIAISLLILSNSKTSVGLVLFVPVLAGITLLIRMKVRISPAVIIMTIPICYIILSNVSGFNMNRISYILYGDSSFTGRTVIWDFAHLEIARRPLFGWGYQSFWLVGPDGPSILDARGWVKTMPHAHNGYLDTMLEMGYVGLALLLTFIVATLHAIGRMVHRDPARAWLVLSLVLFVIVTNFLESTWMRGFDFMWVMFTILVAEIARYSQPFRPRGRSQHRPRFSPDPQQLGPRVALSQPATRLRSPRSATMTAPRRH